MIDPEMDGNRIQQPMSSNLLIVLYRKYESIIETHWQENGVRSAESFSLLILDDLSLIDA